jgi:hypothetical protein
MDKYRPGVTLNSNKNLNLHKDELPAIPNTSQVHSYTIPECWEHRENFEEKCYVGQRGSKR